jgi:tetratricopeptide (TPR) repeat protein
MCCRSISRFFLLFFVVFATGSLCSHSQLSRESSGSESPEQAVPAVEFLPAHGSLEGAILPSPPTQEDVGDALMSHQRYQAAIAAYKNVENGSATVWNKMGIAHQMMFNLDEALRCYQTSLKLDSQNTHVLNNIGTIYDSLKDYRQAERYYRRALRIRPNSALVNKNLGTNLLAQHKYDKGWESYQTALSFDPNIFERNPGLRVDNPASTQERGAMNYYMAKGCVRAGHHARAIEYLRSALNEGFTNAKRIVADSEFVSLRGVPAFEELLAAQSSH